MIEDHLQSLTRIIKRIRANRAGAHVMFLLGITIAIFTTIGVPWLWNPYLHIPGNLLQLELGCQPSEVSIRLISERTELDSAHITPITGQNSTATIAIIPLNWKQTGSKVSIDLRDEQTTRAISNALEQASASRFVIKLQFKRAPSIEVKRVKYTVTSSVSSGNCEQLLLEGQQLLQSQLESRASLVRFRPIQYQIADMVLDHNERVANILVGAMVIAMFFNLGLVLVYWQRAHFSSDSRFAKQVSRRVSEADPILRGKGAAAVINADFARIQRRLVFAKNIGPICGFGLTVSSLIAALHPSIQADKDAFAFLTSLQIALVSTLVGLAMRVLAEFAIRFHRRVCELQLSAALRVAAS